MVTNKDIDKREDRGQDYRAPLIPQDEITKENNSMVYLSTFVAVCGSYSFGTGVSAEFGILVLYVKLPTRV